MKIPTIPAGPLALVPWEKCDAPELYQLWCQPEVRDAVWDGEAIPAERAAEMVREAVRNAGNGVGHWTVRMASAPFSMMGFCGLRRFDGTGRIELLTSFLPQYWGRGYATLACVAVLAYAFAAGDEHVYARTTPGNASCIRLIGRLGMKVHASAWIDDSPDFCFSISREEFRRQCRTERDCAACGFVLSGCAA